MSRPKSPTVSPRLVWGGLAVAIAGAVTISVGIMADWIVVSIVGAVVLLVGAALAVRGGIMFDARSTMAPGEELGHLASGDDLPATVPGDTYDDPDASATARELAARTASLEHAVEASPRPSMLVPAGVVMLAVAATLALMRWHLVNHDDDGTDSYVHTAGAVVLALSGMRCLVGWGPHRIAGLAGLLAGIGLLLEALIGGHAGTGLSGVELALALVAMAAGVTGLLSGKRVEDQQRAVGQGPGASLRTRGE